MAKGANDVRWYGHVRRIDDSRLVQKIYESEEGWKDQEGIDEMCVTAWKKGLTKMQADEAVYERKAWGRAAL